MIVSAGKQMNSKSTKSQAARRFFNSPAMQNLKEQLCDIGRRMWQREYVDGNGGNLAIRVGEDIALCTPTLVSKGFMKPEDMCLVDFEGNQLAGTKNRTSEILMHLQIMQRQPRAVATCHCHPPSSHRVCRCGRAAADALVTEFELFVSLAIAPYRTPGTPELGQLVAELDGPAQHNFAGEPRRRFLEPQQPRGRLFQNRNPRNLLPHNSGREAARRSRPEAVPGATH